MATTITIQKYRIWVVLSSIIILYYIIHKWQEVSTAPYALLVEDKGGARLGNHLFPFASTWALAKRMGRKAKFGSRLSTELKAIFPNLNIEEFSSVDLFWTRVFSGKWQEGGAFDYMEEWISNLPQQDIIVCCYMQSYKYFEPFEKELLQMLQFGPSIDEYATRKVAEISQKLEQPKLIAVHIRRGDISGNVDLFQLGRRLAPASYINKAMNYFRNKNKLTYFLVFSDSLDWAQENIQDNDVQFMSGGTAERDMAIMSRCDHIIITVGTFGWWAAWRVHMNGGNVIYYNNSYVPTGYIGRNYKVHNFMKPEWIALSD